MEIDLVPTEQGCPVFAPSEKPDNFWEPALVTCVEGEKCKVQYRSGTVVDFQQSDLIIRRPDVEKGDGFSGALSTQSALVAALVERAKTSIQCWLPPITEVSTNQSTPCGRSTGLLVPPREQSKSRSVSPTAAAADVSGHVTPSRSISPPPVAARSGHVSPKPSVSPAPIVKQPDDNAKQRTSFRSVTSLITDELFSLDCKSFMSVSASTVGAVLSLRSIFAQVGQAKRPIAEVALHAPCTSFQDYHGRLRASLSLGQLGESLLQLLHDFYKAFHFNTEDVKRTSEFEDPELLCLLSTSLLKSARAANINGDWSAALMAALSIFAASERNAEVIVDLLVVQCAILLLEHQPCHDRVQLTALRLLQTIGSHKAIRELLAAKKANKLVFGLSSDSLVNNMGKAPIVHAALLSLATWLPSCKRADAIKRCPIFVKATQRSMSDARVQVAALSLLRAVERMPKPKLNLGKSFCQVWQSSGGLDTALDALITHPDNLDVITTALEFLVLMSSRPHMARTCVSSQTMTVTLHVLSKYTKNESVAVACLQLLHQLCLSDEGAAAVRQLAVRKDVVDDAQRLCKDKKLVIPFAISA